MVLGDLEKVIKAKIERIGTPLKEWDINIYRGILTGLNEAFIIDSATKDRLISLSPKSAEIIRPILRGKDIHRYSCERPQQWVIFIPWHFPLHEDQSIQGASEIAEIAFKKQYKAVYDYMLSHRQALENRNKAETGIRYEWYALQRFGSNYWQEFEDKKIVWGNLSLRGAYSFAEPGVYINAPSSFIPSGNSFLLAILNSKIGDFYIKQLGVTRNGGYFEYKPMFIEKLPIPKIEPAQEAIFEKLVNQRIMAESDQLSTIDLQIDNLISDLYGLSKDERDHIYKFLDKN